jgi:hypothetical protein
LTLAIWFNLRVLFVCTATCSPWPKRKRYITKMNAKIA